MSYSKEQRDEISQFAREHGAKAASEKFGVPMKTIWTWTGAITRRVPSKQERLEIATYAVEHGLKAASEKYQFTTEAIRKWCHKLGMGDSFRKREYPMREIAICAIKHGRKEAIRKFGCSSPTVTRAKKMYPELSDKIVSTKVESGPRLNPMLMIGIGLRG